MLVQKTFQLTLIPACVRLLPFDDKRWVFSNPVAKRLIQSQKGLGIDQPDQEAVFIQSGQFTNPVGEVRKLLPQIERILVHLSLVKLLIKAYLIEDHFTVTAVIEGRHHPRHNL